MNNGHSREAGIEENGLYESAARARPKGLAIWIQKWAIPELDKTWIN
jgi:hypothetical protein